MPAMLIYSIEVRKLRKLTVAAVQAGLRAHLDFLLQVFGDEVGQVSFVAHRSLQLQGRGDGGSSALRLATSAASAAA